MMLTIVTVIRCRILRWRMWLVRVMSDGWICTRGGTNRRNTPYIFRGMCFVCRVRIMKAFTTRWHHDIWSILRVLCMDVLVNSSGIVILIPFLVLLCLPPFLAYTDYDDNEQEDTTTNSPFFPILEGEPTCREGVPREIESRVRDWEARCRIYAQDL